MAGPTQQQQEKQMLTHSINILRLFVFSLSEFYCVSLARFFLFFFCCCCCSAYTATGNSDDIHSVILLNICESGYGDISLTLVVRGAWGGEHFGLWHSLAIMIFIWPLYAGHDGYWTYVSQMKNHHWIIALFRFALVFLSGQPNYITATNVIIFSLFLSFSFFLFAGGACFYTQYCVFNYLFRRCIE